MVDIPEDIIEQAALGHMESFEAIYRAFNHFVFRVALRMVDDPQDAEEIVQDVFVRVYDQLKFFRFEAKLKTWVYRITVNTALNFRKKRSRQNDQKRAYHENVQFEKKAVKPQYTQEEEHQGMMDLLLNILNPDQRMCIILRSVEGLSYEEIAQVLKMNVNTVRTRLKRAREKLLSARPEVMSYEI